MTHGNRLGRLSLIATAILAAAAIATSGRAVELANITVVDGAIPQTDTPGVSIDSGQSTANFFVDPAPAGLSVAHYPVRIGTDATDDYFNGVLLSTIRENMGRTDSLGNPWNTINMIGMTTLYNEVQDGTLRIVIKNMPGGAAGTNANANVSAAYFPFSEGWIGGQTRSSANGGFPTSFSSLNGIALTDISEPFGARYRVRIPGVTDSRRQGLVFANHGKDEDNFASVAPSQDGDGYNISIHNSTTGGFEADAFAFAYIPYGTPNVTMASIHGLSDLGGATPNPQPTVMNSSGSPFTVTHTGTGTYRLSIPGQSPSSGALLLNSGGVYSTTGGQSQTSQDIITYQADGNDWVIQQRFIGSTALGAPFLEDPAADRGQAFQFAFIPFANAPTAPGPIPSVPSFKDKVLGFNVNIKEFDNSLNDIPGLGGQVTSGTTGYRFQHLRQNKGDNSIAVDGAFLSSADGIWFGSINEGFRDNTTSGGEAAYGMIAAGDSGGGWEFATHIADPGLGTASAVEHNVNFSAAFFGNDTPFQKAFNVLQPPAPNDPGLTISLPGVNTLTSGILVAQAFGNNDDFAVVTPASDGSNWTVNTYDNNTGQSRNEVNWIYLPYAAGNLVAGRVSTDGSVQQSTNPAAFTLQKQGTGQYLLTIPGKTPADGTLLLTPEADAGVEDNLLVYETMGSSFLITGIDMVSFEEKSALTFPTPEDTNFTFAFIDHDAPPTLPTFADADFTESNGVDSADFANWKAGFGTSAGATHMQGDSNGDGDVDGGDFLRWQQQFGLPAATAASVGVPEPGALALVALSLACLGGFRGRRA